MKSNQVKPNQVKPHQAKQQAKQIVITEGLLTALKQPVIHVKGPAFAKLFAHMSTAKCIQQVMPAESCGECLDNCVQCWADHLLE